MTLYKKYTFLLASAACVILVSMFSSHVVPLYDGVGFPDEPYRYVSASANVQNSKLQPSPTSVSVAISGGTNQSDVSFSSKEQGPQVNIYIYGFALKNSVTNAKAFLQSQPKAPNGSKALNSAIAGNIYTFSYVIDRGNLSLKPTTNEQRGYIILRLPQQDGAYATMVYRPGKSAEWQKITTTKVGNDFYQGDIQGFGEYALVPVKSGPSQGNSDWRIRIIIILTVILISLCAILVILRRKYAKSAKQRTK
jgi:hypothetical protein